MNQQHNSWALGARIKRVMSHNALILAHVVIGGIVFIEYVLDMSLPLHTRLEVVVFLFAAFILGAARVTNFMRLNDRPLVHIVLYHLLIGTGLVLLAPIGSMYPFIWVMLMFITNFYYGGLATLGSLLVLVTVLELQLLRAGSGAVTGKNIMVLVAQAGIVLAISAFFVDTQAISDKDRGLLLASIDKAQLERQRLVSLVNSMTDGVVATDGDGIVKLFNASALNVLNTNVDLDGHDIREFLKLIDKNNNPVDIIAVTDQKNTIYASRDLRLQYGDEEIVNLWVSSSPIKLGFRQGNERGFIISFRDITREKSLEEERAEFISVISHELRTPVAITEANISNAQLLNNKSRDPAAINEALEQAHKQSLFLANMLNDLSTLSRAERGKLDMKPELINPAQIISELHDDYLPEAAGKGLQLFTKIIDNTPENITSNKLYVREVLQNFITNAIKYTRKGSVTIGCEAAPNGVAFTVADTGIGISKSDQKRIFDKFFRSEDFRTRESSGTGLGLYITKKLAHLLGAEIAVKSQLNEGSEFTIFIPDLVEQPTEQPADQAA